MEPYRLFVALELPEPVRAELAGAQAQLRRAGLPVRWAAPEQLHLTLRFLGDTDPAQLPALTAALGRAAAASAPLRLRLAEPGGFPSARRPSVIWVGVVGEAAALVRLAGALEHELAALGIAREPRPFRAHLTLGRTRREADQAELARVAAALHELPPPAPAEWLADQIVLFRSELRREGARYTALVHARLGGAGA